MKNYAVGIKIYNTFYVEAESEEEAEQKNPNIKLVLPWYFKKEILKKDSIQRP